MFGLKYLFLSAHINEHPKKKHLPRLNNGKPHLTDENKRTNR